MEHDLKWFIGIFVTLMIAISGSIIASFRHLSAKLTKSNEDVNQRIDDVKDNYVRRDDLNGHIDRIDENLKELRDETRQNHRQLLEAITRDRS